MGFHKTATFAVIASGYTDATGALPAAVLLDDPVAPALFGTGLRRQASLRTAHRHEFDYDPRPGYLYVRSRAISSRCNDNYDEFPAEEIKAAYASFVGKPVFVNHHNSNHRRARGVIIDAALHEDTNPDGTPDTWVEVLMEVDAIRFPRLAEAVIAGAIDRTSMGTDVQYSVCTACGNKASNPTEYCAHIPRMKGQRITRRTASGRQEAVLVAERCYGLRFFENSLLVEQPADPTAYTFGLDTRGLAATASISQRLLREVVAEAEAITKQAWDEGEHPRGHEHHGAVVTAATCSQCNPGMGFGPDALCSGHGHLRKMETQFGPIDRGDIQQGPKADDVLFPIYATALSGKGWGSLRVAELKPVEVAGLAIQAADTGRILMIQRSYADKDDPARGTWEFPGGHLDEGEHPPTAAIREFAEEVGCEPPHGDIVGSWRSGDIYQGFHMIVPTEADVDVHCHPDDRVGNPDDPGGDDLESVAWWLPADAKKNPSLRSEVKSGTDWSIFQPYVRKATASRGWASLTVHAAAYPYDLTLACGCHVRYVGSQPNQVQVGQHWRCGTHGDTTVTEVGGSGADDAGLGFDRWGAKERKRPYWDDGQPVPDRDEVLRRMLEHAPWSQPDEDEPPPERHLHVVRSAWAPRRADLDEFERGLEAAMTAPFQTLAYGEQKAPAEVDTLREDACPVCGADEGYNGSQCLVCQYVKPPDKFGDPDLEKAKQVDLRGGDAADDGQTGEPLVCPHCGATFVSSGPAKAKTTVADPGASPSMSAPTVDGKTSAWQRLSAGNPFEKKDDGDAAKPKKDATEEDAKPPSDEEKNPDAGEAPEAVQAGDTCPDCGVGVLEPDPTGGAGGEAAQPDGASGEVLVATDDDADGLDDASPAEDAQVAPEGVQDEDDADGDQADDDNPFAKKKKPKPDPQDDDEDAKAPPFKKKTSRVGSRPEGSEVGMPEQPRNERQSLIATVQRQQRQITALIANDETKDRQIEALRSGLLTLAKAAGVGDHAKFALLKTAEDEKNDEVATTDEQALKPDAKDDVESVGAVPAPANAGVTPAGVTDVQNANVTLPTEPFNKLVDVTQPTPGTDTVPDNHVETDVKAGTPSQQPFDNVGGWTAAKEDPQTRLITSMRLARLRKAANVPGAAEIDDLALGEQINGDSALPLVAILHEVDTLSQVLAGREQAQGRPTARALVPQAGARAVPSLSAAASASPQAPTQGSSTGQVSRDEFLF